MRMSQRPVWAPMAPSLLQAKETHMSDEITRSTSRAELETWEDPYSESYVAPRHPPMMRRLPPIKRRTSYIVMAVLAIAALLSFFLIADIASSPETHSSTIETLDKKKDTVMGLVGASGASSTAISLLPGDAGTPIAEKLVDLSSDFLVVVAAIYLEKYLLTIIGFFTFKFLVPVGCVLLIAALALRERDYIGWALVQIAFKIMVFGLAMYMVVPVSVFVSGMIERTYQASIDETIENAEQTNAKIEEAANEEQGEGQDLWTTITQIPETIAQIPDGVAELVEEGQKALNDFMEALAVMIVTSCVIPLLVLLFFLWLVKVILGVNIDMPVRMLRPRSLRRRGTRSLTKR